LSSPNCEIQFIQIITPLTHVSCYNQSSQTNVFVVIVIVIVFQLRNLLAVQCVCLIYLTQENHIQPVSMLPILHTRWRIWENLEF